MGDPAPFDRVATEYDRLYGDAACRAEDADLVELLRPVVHDHGDRVLDVGCGTGWVLDHAPPLEVGHYVGFDVSTQMVHQARSKHGLAPGTRYFSTADMSQRWPVPDHSFSLVLSLWCSASYARPRHVIRESVRVLEPGGMAVLMPHAGGSWSVRGVRGDGYLPPECYNGSTGWEPWTMQSVDIAVHEPDVRPHLGMWKVEGFRASAPLPHWVPEWAHRAWRRLRPGERPDQCAFLVVRLLKGER